MQNKKDKVELTISINKTKMADLFLVFSFMAVFVGLGIGIGWITWANAGKKFRRETVPGWFKKDKSVPENSVTSKPETQPQPVDPPKKDPVTQPVDNGSQQNLPEKQPEKEEPTKLF